VLTRDELQETPPTPQVAPTVLPCHAVMVLGGRLTLAVLLTLGLLGCKAREGEQCAKPEDCGQGLTCNDLVCANPTKLKEAEEAREAKEAALEKFKAEVEHDRHEQELAEHARHCVKSKDCRRFGACGTWRDGKLFCFPTSAIDCQQSEHCREKGVCFFRPGTDTSLPACR
jgi:hypothetical protein